MKRTTLESPWRQVKSRISHAWNVRQFHHRPNNDGSQLVRDLVTCAARLDRTRAAPPVATKDLPEQQGKALNSWEGEGGATAEPVPKKLVL